ncbi:hypothetical protein OH76DRAFT_1487311 [Lentinus brumalis]|uniref:Uncharacterized protein n=1 Tax=Lentinus brumalis TaxID=2498619 RepID=A0A371CVD9_9APHY|nr:hypothetical protein OH76DRAFT_1487311 [Polyporus brumalis]
MLSRDPQEEVLQATNGLKWIFFSFTPGPDVGNMFERSDQIVASSPQWRAVISAVLRDMIDSVVVVRLPITPFAQGLAVSWGRTVSIFDGLRSHLYAIPNAEGAAHHRRLLDSTQHGP